MMKIAVVTGWNIGFQKVQFTELLRKDFGYSLAEAKAATDGVLNNERLELQILNPEASRIEARLAELRAKFVLEESKDDGLSSPPS